MARILISLIGAALIFWGGAQILLGIAGEKSDAVIIGIHRQGGERNEVIRGQYTYSIGYAFPLANGEMVDGNTTQIGGAAYFKADGADRFPVRYFKFAPYINAPEDDTRPSAGQPALMLAGVLLIIIMNRRKKLKMSAKKPLARKGRGLLTLFLLLNIIFCRMYLLFVGIA